MAEATTKDAFGRLRAAAEGNPATAKLMEAAQDYLAVRVERTAADLGRKLGQAANNLSSGTGSVADIASVGQKLASGRGMARAVAETGASKLKDRLTGGVKQALGSLTGKGGRGKGGGRSSVTIVEDIDVGVPARVAYDQWTQFQEFSSWAKGVESVDNVDEVSANWKLKVFKSRRSWRSSITEQTPDERIVWTSEGAKASTKGVVTFHPLGDRLTRVLLVIEYFPQGLMEKTGNIWRAQGRRARLDLKHFRRFVMNRGEATGAWRGEIRDGEVVRSHEEAVQAEQEGQEEQPEQEGQSEREGQAGPEDETAEAEDAEYDEDVEDQDDQLDDEDFADEDLGDEDDQDDEDLEDERYQDDEYEANQELAGDAADEDEVEDEADEAPRGRSRSRAGARR
jgi:uncharacterized membrane protein